MADLSDELDDVLWGILEDFAAPAALRAEANRLLEDRLDLELQGALSKFAARTVIFVNLTNTLEGAINKAAGNAHWIGRLRSLANRVSTARAEEHNAVALRSARDPAQPAQTTDETSVPATFEPAPLPRATPPITTVPTTSDSTDYAVLRDEYVRFFNGMVIADQHEAEVSAFAAQAVANRARYESVGLPLGIPWWFIAGTHLLESSFNFDRHLHNGDSLSARTVRVPAGRPTGKPPFTWEKSAVDALTLRGLKNKGDWSLPRALYRWEAFNGFGYRQFRIPTPYLWSFSNIYAAGKYERDGVFNSALISKQCGAAVLLAYLQRRGSVADIWDEAREPSEIPVVPPPPPPAAVPAAGLTGFAKFYADNVAAIAPDFSASEFLFKGASHSATNPNSDPPESLWPNMVKLAEVLQEFRTRIGSPVRLTSIYRSPRYNSAIGGATHSLHKEFKAADFHVPAVGRPRDWAAILDDMRHAPLTKKGAFRGGLHAYGTFVHVDVRGENQNWE